MIFGYFIFFTATLLSFVAAYYSVTGLATIFAAAAIPVIVMGSILELGKVVATVWLHSNWYRVPRMFKLYLVPAVAFLMLLTSMGIFGFLSKAHLDQAVPTGDIAAQVEIYDEKIKTHKDNIDAARKALRQMDESVDQLMGRSTDERGADKAVQLRRNQAKERQRLQTEIAQAQKEIAKLQEQRAPIASELRKVEAEVGPIKYLAALVYDDTTDHAVLESAVRWVIILIVLVFDPLALVLILAGTKQISWAREQNKIENETTPVYVVETTEPPTAEEKAEIEAEAQEIDIDQVNAEAAAITNEPNLDAIYDDIKELEVAQEEQAKLQDKIKTLEQQLESLAAIHETQLGDIEQLNNKLNAKECDLNELLATSTNVSESYEQLSSEHASLKDVYKTLLSEKLDLEQALAQKIKDNEDLTKQIADLETVLIELSQSKTELEATSTIEAVDPEPQIVPAVAEEANDDAIANITVIPVEIPNLEASAEESTAPNAAFGTKFPTNPNKGDLFLRVDYLPSRLYKWNDTKWIEIDKAITDSYTYDEAYIKFLITKLAGGDYDTDDLSAAEQEQVTEYLKRTRRV